VLLKDSYCTARKMTCSKSATCVSQKKSTPRNSSCFSCKARVAGLFDTPAAFTRHLICCNTTSGCTNGCVEDYARRRSTLARLKPCLRYILYPLSTCKTARCRSKQFVSEYQLRNIHFVDAVSTMKPTQSCPRSVHASAHVAMLPCSSATGFRGTGPHMFATPVVTLYPGSCFCCCCPCFRIARKYEEKTWGSSAHFGTGGSRRGGRCVSGRRGADIPMGLGVAGNGIATLTGAGVVFGTIGAGGGASAAGGYIARNLLA
jgi:hypothetical protein